MTFIDFTLSNARRFYSSMGNPLVGKGLTTSKTVSPLIRPDQPARYFTSAKNNLIWPCPFDQTVWDKKHIIYCCIKSPCCRVVFGYNTAIENANWLLKREYEIGRLFSYVYLNLRS